MEAESAMMKPASPAYCGQPTMDNLDQALKGMLLVLRKPLKLTATLKRRALKNNAASKSPTVTPSRQLKKP
jgi:hypothetical protein